MTENEMPQAAVCPEEPLPMWKALPWRKILFGILIFVCFAFLYLYGNGAHSLWDRDEPRYADAAQRMLRTGDFTLPMFNDTVRYDKPILVYWLMDIPMRLLGINEFSARAMQALAGAGVVTCVWALALMLGFGMISAFVAAVACGLSPLLMMVSKAATTDSILLLMIIGALMVHWAQLYRGFRWWRHILFWVILGLSVLQKGHPALIVVGLAYWFDYLWTIYLTRYDKLVQAPPHPVMSDRREQLRRTAVGIGILLIVALPWVISVWVKTDGEFLRTQFRDHVVGHAATSMDSHWGPAVYYVPVLCLALISVLPLLLSALPGMHRQIDLHSIRFLISWLIPGFLVFSLAGTKLPHYILPVLPPLALLTGYSLSCQPQIESWRPVPRVHFAWSLLFCALFALLMAVINRKTGWPATMLGIFSLASLLGAWWLTPVLTLWRLGAVIIGILGFCMSVALPCALLYLRVGHLLVGLLIAFVSLLLSCWTCVFWWKRNIKVGFSLSIASLVSLWAILFFFLLPAIEPLRPSKPIGQWIAANMPENAKLFMVGYKEPSLVFYSGRALRETGTVPEERDVVYKAIEDEQTSVGVVITKDIWDQWTAAKNPPPFFGVPFEGDYFQFQKGGRCHLMVIVK